VSFTWPALLSGAWKPTVIAASWFGTAMQMLSPFELERTRRGLSWLPFRSFAESNPSAIVSHAIELALVYVPVGIALACWLRSSRRHHIWNALAIVALMQAPIELAQGLIAGRYPDMTDIVLAVAGGFAGYSMQAAAVRMRCAAGLVRSMRRWGTAVLARRGGEAQKRVAKGWPAPGHERIR